MSGVLSVVVWAYPVMLGARERELWILLLGDIFILYISLWLTLLARHLAVPSQGLWESHFWPFTWLFGIWVVIWYISGLYDKHTIVFKRHLPSLVLYAQFFNLCAAIIFFAMPFVGIAPKRNLLIYLGISSILLIAWRLLFGRARFGRKKYAALLVADGPEVEELVEEVNGNTRYDFEFVKVVDSALLSETGDVEARLLSVVDEKDISLIVVDTRNERVASIQPFLFTLAFLDFRFTVVDMHRLYEDIFDRVPISTLRYSWFLEHMPQSSKKSYDIAKRIIDLLGAVILGIPLFILFPILWCLVKLEGWGPVLIPQQRLGQNNTTMTVYKIRSMLFNDKGQWLPHNTANKVTRVGAILRVLSVDELPQIWNIFKGEMSFIGPRNDIGGIATQLSEAIPYYNIRYMIRPGITGWAQTHQQYAPGNVSPQSLEEAKVRLAYDLYYIKHRSFVLDMAIALRTISTVLRRVGGLLFK